MLQIVLVIKYPHTFISSSDLVINLGTIAALWCSSSVLMTRLHVSTLVCYFQYSVPHLYQSCALSPPQAVGIASCVYKYHDICILPTTLLTVQLNQVLPCLAVIWWHNNFICIIWGAPMEASIKQIEGDLVYKLILLGFNYCWARSGFLVLICHVKINACIV